MGRGKFSFSPSHRAPRAFLLSFSFSPASLRLKEEVSAEEWKELRWREIYTTGFPGFVTSIYYFLFDRLFMLTYMYSCNVF